MDRCDLAKRGLSKLTEEEWKLFDNARLVDLSSNDLPEIPLPAVDHLT